MDTIVAGPARLDAIYEPDQTLGVDRSLDNNRELSSPVSRISSPRTPQTARCM
jgi:hypothetical protein